MTITSDDVPVIPSGTAKLSSAFALKQIAQIASPVVKGQTLQATAVVLSNKFAYVSYNMAGLRCRSRRDRRHPAEELRQPVLEIGARHSPTPT